MITFAQAQRVSAQASSIGIAAAAVVLTYTGTAQFCHQHGAPGWRGYTIAAMNDLAVLVGIAWPERPLQCLAGLCAGFTVWANFAHAAPGWAGAVVSLVPAGLAILMIGALEWVLRTSDSGQVTPDSGHARADTRGDTLEDTGQDTTGDTDQTPDRTSEGTPGGQDTGHQEDTGPDTEEDTEEDTGGDIVSPPEVDKPQVAARKTPDTRAAAQETTVVAFTGQRARVITAVIEGRMTQKDAAEKLHCSTKTISRYVAAAKTRPAVSAVG